MCTVLEESTKDTSGKQARQAMEKPNNVGSL